MQTKNGLTLVGYVKSEHGVGESVRNLALGIDKTGYGWNAYDFEENNCSRQNCDVLDQHLTKDLKYPVVIINVNADQMPLVQKHFGEKKWAEKYKIGIWYWELSVFPDKWLKSFELVNEIWAPTRFIQDSISMKANIPVIHMPIPLELKGKTKILRQDWHLPERSFLFLFMYDALSLKGRKNPKSVINAFMRAFDAGDDSVGLVIKVNNANLIKDDILYLNELKKERGNIFIIDDILSRTEVNGLIDVCNAVISLHHSEGLGLLCQEAMFFGKPVIATNWSGNTDFMSENDSCLVKYELKQIGEDIGPYEKWQKWAEPDVEQAAYYMKRLKTDSTYYNLLSYNARNRILQEYSPQKCGDRMRERLDYIFTNLKALQHDNQTVKRMSLYPKIGQKDLVILYGIGRVGQKVFSDIRDDFSCNFVAICDNGYKDTTYEKIPVYKHKECLLRFPNAYYFITVQKQYVSIISDLLISGISKDHIYFYNNSKNSFESCNEAKV